QTSPHFPYTTLSDLCCTISMFDNVRQWNRENIPGYIEIYIKVSMETLQKRDQKGLYTNSDGSVAGVNFAIEEPKNPDLILENDGDRKSTRLNSSHVS